jgi:hypothetical protein
MSALPNVDLELGQQSGQCPGEDSPGMSIMISPRCIGALILSLASRDSSGEEQLTERQRSYRGAYHSFLDVDRCLYTKSTVQNVQTSALPRLKLQALGHYVIKPNTKVSLQFFISSQTYFLTVHALGHGSPHVTSPSQQRNAQQSGMLDCPGLLVSLMNCQVPRMLRTLSRPLL